MADIRNFNGNESKTKQKNPLRKQSNLRLLKNEDTADYKEKIRKHRLSSTNSGTVSVSARRDGSIPEASRAFLAIWEEGFSALPVRAFFNVLRRCPNAALSTLNKNASSSAG